MKNRHTLVVYRKNSDVGQVIKMNTASKWNGKKFTLYIIFTFIIGWVLQIIGSVFANRGNQNMFTLCLTAAMFAPFISTLIAGIPLRGMGWLPKLKGKMRYFFAALWLPAVFGILGGALYFAIFPERLDLTGKYLTEVGGEAVIEQMAAQGVTIPVYLAAVAIMSVTYVPFINMFAALGEEVGWRGAMQPMLNERLGKVAGRIAGGVIWGAWHWPAMLLAGYEYGKEYFGAPFLGMAVFCLATTVMGVLLDAAYEKTGCIWIPSLGHGAINAFTIGIMVLDPAYTDQMILGPAPIGIISMIPALIFALFVLFGGSKKQKTDVESADDNN